MRPTTGFSVFVPCGMCKFDISTAIPYQLPLYNGLAIVHLLHPRYLKTLYVWAK